MQAQRAYDPGNQIPRDKELLSINPSINLGTYLPIYLSNPLSICRTIYRSTYLPIYLSPVYLSTYLRIHLSAY